MTPAAMVKEAQARAGASLNLTSANVHHAGVFVSLIAAGCEWETDILPAIDKTAASFTKRGQTLHSWAIITDAAKTNRDNRLRPDPDRTDAQTRARIRHAAWARVLGEMAPPLPRAQTGTGPLA